MFCQRFHPVCMAVVARRWARVLGFDLRAALAIASSHMDAVCFLRWALMTLGSDVPCGDLTDTRRLARVEM